MKIRLYLITTQSEFDRLPQGWQVNDCDTSACRNVIEAVDQLQGQGIYPTFSNNVRVIAYSFTQLKADHPALVSALRLGGPPAVLFYDEDTRYVIASLRAGKVSAYNIINLYKKLQEFVPGEQDGTSGYYTTQGKFVPLQEVLEHTEGSEFTLGLFNTGLGGVKLPSIIWLLAALAAGYKTVSAKENETGWRVLWGTAAVFALVNYKNSKNG